MWGEGRQHRGLRWKILEQSAQSQGSRWYDECGKQVSTGTALQTWAEPLRGLESGHLPGRRPPSCVTCMPGRFAERKNMRLAPEYDSMHLGLQVGKAEACTLHVGWVCQGVGWCFVSFSLLSSWHQDHGFICDSGAALPLAPARRPVSDLNICPKSEPPIPFHLAWAPGREVQWLWVCPHCRG